MPSAIESVAPPVELAHGSVAARLPGTGRKRPPTVEFPTLDSDVVEAAPAEARPAPPVAPQEASPSTPTKQLPSIFAVIDRRRTSPDLGPPPAARPPEGEAVPEPIAHEKASVTARRGDGRGPDVAPVRPKGQERPGPAGARQKRPGSFSEADRAFFAAGEDLERAEQESFDDIEEAAPRRRPTLWRRLTGRGRTP